ncbi:MAG: hypothetical protein OXJ54_12650, partial [Gemmatimonadetes bacterium]|nr:hypothetical protein [Candidatus Palauibacter rhopaloidicola]
NIVPCGIRGREVTSLAECTGGPVPMAAVEDAVVSAFAEVFAASPVHRPRREAADGPRDRHEIPGGQRENPVPRT